MDLSKAKKLFARPKDDPSFLAKQVKIRQILLKNLARVVKETQLLFARTEGEIIKDCRPVQRLCARFEDILRHGLKAGWFSAGKDPTFWPIVLKISRKQAIEYINRLQYAQTDSGKCRAWIRLAVNECSLESYINVLTHDSQMLSYYYESHAFLRDEEVVSPFRQLLTGLSQIGFDISVDTASLEFAPAPEVLEPVLRLRAPQPVQGKKTECVNSSSPGTSSGSSWGSSSADSSSLSTSTGLPEATPTNELHVHLHDSNVTPDVKSIQTLKDEASGLEASYHIEDNVLVIDSVSETGREGVPYTDLSRFNQALEESEEEIIKEESKESIEVERETIEPSSVKDDDDVIFDEKLPHSKTDGNTTPLIDPDLVPASDDIPTSTSKDTLDEVDMSSSSQEVLDKPNVDISLDEEIQAEVAEFQEKEVVKEEEEKEQVEEVEYSYGDILLMAKGLSPLKDKEVSGRDRDDTLKETVDVVSYSLEGPATDDDDINPPVETTHSSVAVSIDLPTSVDINSTNPFLTDLADQHTPVPVTFSTNPFLDDEEGQSDTYPVMSSNSNPFDPQPSPTNRPHSPAITSASPPADPQPPIDNTVINETNQLLNIMENETDTSKEDEHEALTDNIGEGYSREEEKQVSFLMSEGIEKMSLNEEYFEEELTIELVEYQIAQLKNHLRRHNNDINSQKKLLKLQLLKQEMKELSEVDTSDVKVCGHQLTLLPRRLKARKCDTCHKPTVNPLQVVMSCSFCGYFTHAKCLPQINQKCIFLAMKEQSGYTMNICPEKGLTPQHFRCACCNQALNNSTEVRLCDYTGQYYCPDCHHNETAVIPARVVHNWDFTSRKVSCGSYKLLNALYSRPLITVKSINPKLYTYVHEITTIEGLRSDILLMKEFLVKCDRARTEKLIQELNSWPHFKDSSTLFSLSDLINVQEGNLLSQLQVVHQMFLSHICNECEKCSATGTACAVCHSRDLLFPFSKDVIICPNCSSHFHKDCYVSLKSVCTVCSIGTGKRKSRFSRKKN